MDEKTKANLPKGTIGDQASDSTGQEGEVYDSNDIKT
jgi:hypothetical protein